MLWWWLAVEAFFIAFFVYGYVIYRRRVVEYQQREDTNPGDEQQ
ncbi:MAG: hypothetical protein ABIS27_03620 [Longimicrobiales bacterium]